MSKKSKYNGNTKKKKTWKVVLGVFIAMIVVTLASIVVDEIRLGPTYALELDMGPGKLIKPEDFKSLKSKESVGIKLPNSSDFETSEDIIFDGWTLNGIKHEGEFFPKEDSVLKAKWIYVTYKDEVESIAVDYKVIEKDSADMLVGERAVETVGVNGEIEKTHRSKYHDDELIETKLHSEVVKVEPVDEVVLNGTKVVEVVAPVQAAVKPAAVQQKPATTSKPAPTPAPAETTAFKNCTELRKVYPSGVKEGHPAYQSKMDRDKDGWACE